MPVTSLDNLKGYVDRRLRKYALSATVGFVILAGGIGVALWGTGKAARVNSEIVCGIVARLDQANKASYEKGEITLKERQYAIRTYSILRESSRIDCSEVQVPSSQDY